MESGIDFLLGKIAAFMAGKEKSLHKFSQYPLKPNQQLCTSYNLWTSDEDLQLFVDKIT